MEPSDFDVSVTRGALVVQGEKQFHRESKKGHYHLMGCAYGRFQRTILLPAAIDDNLIKARYSKGVLTVTLGEANRTKRHRIEVQTS